MSDSTQDKLDGFLNRTKGSIKKGIAKVLDKPKLSAEGSIDKVKGRIQGIVGNAKEVVEKAADKIDPKIKKLNK